MKAQNILVTGGTGYIGKNLILALLNNGHTIYATTRATITQIQNKNLTWITYNNSIGPIDLIFKQNKIETVIHLAAPNLKKITSSKEKSKLMHDVQIKLGAYLLESMTKYSTTKIINIGSYWEHAMGSKLEVPNNLYSTLKLDFQRLIDQYVQRHNISAITLKLYDVFGGNDTRDKLLNNIVKNINNNEKVSLTDGLQYCSFTHVNDVISAIKTAMASFIPATHKKYFIHNNESMSLKNYVDILIKQLGFTKTDLLLWGQLDKPKQQIQKPYLGPTLPGWKAKIKFADGIKDLINV